MIYLTPIFPIYSISRLPSPLAYFDFVCKPKNNVLHYNTFFNIRLMNNGVLIPNFDLFIWLDDADDSNARSNRFIILEAIYREISYG